MKLYKSIVYELLFYTTGFYNCKTFKEYCP